MTVRTAAALASALAALVPTVVLAAQDGWLDPAFGQAGRQIVAFDLGYNNWDRVRGMAVLPDSRILLAGSVGNAPQRVGIGLARLDPDGQVDEAFGRPWHLPGGWDWAQVHAAALQADGKLVAAGTGFDGTWEHGLVCRFQADGSLDPGFATIDNALGAGCRAAAEGIDSGFHAVALQADGKIALAGLISPNSAHGLVVRLDAQGNFDDSFGDGGRHVLLPNSTNFTGLTAISPTPDGDLVAVGFAHVSINTGWQIFRLRGEDGQLDTTFDGDGLKPVNFDLVANGSDSAHAVRVLSNGSVLVAGTAGAGADGTCPAVVRLTSTGQFDGVLDGDGQYIDAFCSNDLYINDMLVQSDGRIVLAGGVSDDFMALRITPEGQRDATFGFNGLSTIEFGPAHGIPLAKDYGYRIASQGGRLLLAGATDPGDDGEYDFAITRLDNDLIYADDLE